MWIWAKKHLVTRRKKHEYYTQIQQWIMNIPYMSACIHANSAGEVMIWIQKSGTRKAVFCGITCYTYVVVAMDKNCYNSLCKVMLQIIEESLDFHKWTHYTQGLVPPGCGNCKIHLWFNHVTWPMTIISPIIVSMDKPVC